LYLRFKKLFTAPHSASAPLCELYHPSKAALEIMIYISKLQSCDTGFVRPELQVITKKWQRSHMHTPRIINCLRLLLIFLHLCRCCYGRIVPHADWRCLGVAVVAMAFTVMYAM
jgi:hypothetical protein